MEMIRYFCDKCEADFHIDIEIYNCPVCKADSSNLNEIEDGFDPLTSWKDDEEDYC